MVVEESVIMMEVDLVIDSVREDEGIPLENLHIKNNKSNKNIIKIQCLRPTLWSHHFHT